MVPWLARRCQSVSDSTRSRGRCGRGRRRGRRGRGASDPSRADARSSRCRTGAAGTGHRHSMTPTVPPRYCTGDDSPPDRPRVPRRDARPARRGAGVRPPGGAYHPEIEGLENTLRPSGTPSSSATTTSRPTCTSPRTACCSPSTTRARPGHRRTGSIATSTYAEVQRALINGSDRVPTLAELFDAFPDARFNIDLKAPGAVPRWLGSSTSARPGTGSASGPSRPPAAPVPPPHGKRWPRRRRRARSRRTGCCPPRRPARHPRPSPGPPGPAPGRPLTDRHRRARRRAHRAGVHVHVWTIDDPDEMRRSSTVVSMA